MVGRDRERWQKYSSGAEKRQEKKDTEEMFKMSKGSLEKLVVVKSATGEGNELMDCASSQEDGGTVVEANSTAAKDDAVCVDTDIDKYDPAN
jgi:hypothetical protein